MGFAADYLAQLERYAARADVPRVAALHLPPPEAATPTDGRGEFCALELEDGSIGLSYVLLDDTLAALHGGAGGPALAGADALALARAYRDADGARRALGFAAANAITASFFRRAGYTPPASGDSIGNIAPAAHDHIGMIGLFPPLLPAILGSGARLTVVELKAELAGEREGYRVTLDGAELERCDKVVSTSTLLLNDTLDAMLGHCRNAEVIALIGPSAGCLPDALFTRGVTSLGGTTVVDRAGFINALRHGEKHSRHARKFAIGRGDYPGFEALLART